MLVSLLFAFIFSHSTKQNIIGPFGLCFCMCVENSFFNLVISSMIYFFFVKNFMLQRIKYEFPINYVEKSWQNPKPDTKHQWKMNFYSSKTRKQIWFFSLCFFFYSISTTKTVIKCAKKIKVFVPSTELKFYYIAKAYL